MQLTSRAQTKVQLPLFRAGLIARSALERRLGEALTRQRLVLLVAPAGYGKTAALSRQLERLAPRCSSAWVTVDEEDDLQRLLAYLIEALEPLDPPWRMAPEALAERAGQEGTLREAVEVLLAALAATDVERGVLALDDLHTVSDSRVFEFLQLVLRGLPDNWTLAIASRIDPPLPLARLRGQRELAEFRHAALSFSLQEVEQLWRMATGQDDPALARSLHERTQGWAAGLSLSLDTAVGRRPAGPAGPASQKLSRRHMFDYLADEVLTQMPEELRDFLLRCSVLPELSADRCAAVSAHPRAAELLEEIERRGLFVAVLDGETLTLRLHDLFRDFLEEQLRRRHPDEVPLLLRRAAQFEVDPVRKVALFLRAGAWAAAEQAVVDAVDAALALGRIALAKRLIDQFPASLREHSANLAFARGLCAWHDGDSASLRDAMQIAAAEFDLLEQPRQVQWARALAALGLMSSGNVDEARQLSVHIRASPADLQGRLLMELFDYWHTGYYGPAEGPGRHLRTIVDCLLSSRDAALWYRCMPRVHLFLGRPGVGAQLRRLMEGALVVAGEEHPSLRAAANLIEISLLLWQGNVTAAEAALERTSEDSRWLGQPDTLRGPLLIYKAQLDLIRADRNAFEASRQAILAHAHSLAPGGRLVGLFLPTIVRMSAAAEDWDGVRKALAMLEGHPVRRLPHLQRYFETFDAQLALHEGRSEEALTLLRKLLEPSRQTDIFTLNATVCTRLALAELRYGTPRSAWEAIAPMVERISASGEVGEILIAGVDALTVLSKAEWGDAAPAEGVATLKRWAELGRLLGMQDASDPGNVDLLRLSEREFEVLALVAAGQSNKLIARALDLSPHTVKRHVARILDRLDLSSRGQAAAWYAKHLAGRGSDGT